MLKAHSHSQFLLSFAKRSSAPKKEINATEFYSRSKYERRIWLCISKWNLDVCFKKIELFALTMFTYLESWRPAVGSKLKILKTLFLLRTRLVFQTPTYYYGRGVSFWKLFFFSSIFFSFVGSLSSNWSKICCYHLVAVLSH